MKVAEVMGNIKVYTYAEFLLHPSHPSCEGPYTQQTVESEEPKNNNRSSIVQNQRCLQKVGMQKQGANYMRL